MRPTCFLYLLPWSSHHYVNYFFRNLTKTSFFSSYPSLAAFPLSTQTADPRKSTPSMLWWCGSRISINKSTILLGTIFSFSFPFSFLVPFLPVLATRYFCLHWVPLSSAHHLLNTFISPEHTPVLAILPYTSISC